MILSWKVICLQEFIPSCLIRSCIIVHSSLSESFIFPRYQLLMSPLSFLILFKPSHFLAECINGLSVLFLFSKNKLLVSFYLFSCLFNLCFMYFCSDLWYFLPSTNFGLHFSFSSSLRCKVRLFEIFLVSCCRHLSL